MNSVKDQQEPRDHDDRMPTAPSLLLALLEAPRALSEASALWPARRFLERLPPGDGHAVMTLPGFMASDRSLRLMRRYLRSWGYHAQRWELGRNLGTARDGGLQRALDARVRRLYEQSGGKVSLVGWSLGGLLARETARRNSSLVRNVITLGSPLGDPRATSVWRLIETTSGSRISDDEIRRRTVRLRRPIGGVPTTAIYSKSDAVVSWRIARLPAGETVESIGVTASHFGMGFNPVIFYLIADRLRQAEGTWQPFEKNGWHKLFFE